MPATPIQTIYSREALCEDCYPRVEAYYLKDWHGYDMAAHRHARMEIMYVIQGRCAIETDSRTLQLKKGEFILLDAGVSHGLRVEPSTVCRMLNIEFNLSRQGGPLPLRAAAHRSPALLRFLNLPRPWQVFSDSDDVYALLRRVVNCMDGAEEGQPLEENLLMTELLLALSTLMQRSIDSRNTGQTHAARAARFIQQNYYRGIGMEDIAAHTGVAQGYLSRLFRAEYGMPPMAFLTQLRIKKAKMLLSKTELPLIDISAYVGVASRQYFNQLFKKHEGCTPGEYRREYLRQAPIVNTADRNGAEQADFPG